MALPQPADISVDEKLAAFDSVPLFMKSLPEDYDNDPAISALQSLAHEGTPDGKFFCNFMLFLSDPSQREGTKLQGSWQ